MACPSFVSTIPACMSDHTAIRMLFEHHSQACKHPEILLLPKLTTICVQQHFQHRTRPQGGANDVCNGLYRERKALQALATALGELQRCRQGRSAHDLLQQAFNSQKAGAGTHLCSLDVGELSFLPSFPLGVGVQHSHRELHDELCLPTKTGSTFNKHRSDLAAQY